ncbi:MAG: DUF2834 domain-containing protein [Deltaproteobacteria bacterium]|nr:DUF2834 domain-containing protein [Deltaproteobacteria bacterium]
MSTKSVVTLIICGLGWLVSYVCFFRWHQVHGFGLGPFLAAWVEAFTESPGYATGFLFDLLSITVLVPFLAIVDRHRIGARAAIAMVLAIGLSVSMSIAIYLIALWRHHEAERG